MNTQVTSTHLHQTVQGYLETLALETDQARKSEKMQKYLEFVAKFHQYSPSNILLIMFARPDATQVAGYQAWKKMGRYVMKGEKGIPIFAPMIHKEDPDKDDSPKVLHGFRTVYVFDVSQTDGEPLPPIPDWKSPEKNIELNEKLIRFADSKGITVIFKELPGETQGVSKGGVIELSPNAGTKTLIHELAHELMHQRGELLDHRARELQAEATAFIVSKHFCLHGLKSSNYISLLNFDSPDVLQCMSEIQETALHIITFVDNPMG